MTAPQALLGFWSGKLALVLGSDTTVWLVNPKEKQFVVEQHGQVIDEGRIAALQAKRFTLAATGTREITRTTVDLNCLLESAVA